MRLLAGTLGIEMFGVENVALVAPLWKAGLVWNDPAPWQADQLAIEMISAKRLMRHIGGPNHLFNFIGLDPKVPP